MAHGVIMIFFVAMPLVIGLMNFVVRLQLRAPGMAMMRLPVFTWTALCTNVFVFTFVYLMGMLR